MPLYEKLRGKLIVRAPMFPDASLAAKWVPQGLIKAQCG